MLPTPERIRTLAVSASVARLSVDGAPSPARGEVDGRGRPVLLVRPGETRTTRRTWRARCAACCAPARPAGRRRDQAGSP